MDLSAPPPSPFCTILVQFERVVREAIQKWTPLLPENVMTVEWDNSPMPLQELKYPLPSVRRL